jgi:hypothetical protein
MSFIKKVIAYTKEMYFSLMLKEAADEIHMPHIVKKYSIPAYQNGDDTVDEETIEEKEEEADMSGATTQER